MNIWATVFNSTGNETCLWFHFKVMQHRAIILDIGASRKSHLLNLAISLNTKLLCSSNNL